MLLLLYLTQLGTVPGALPRRHQAIIQFSCFSKTTKPEQCSSVLSRHFVSVSYFRHDGVQEAAATGKVDGGAEQLGSPVLIDAVVGLQLHVPAKHVAKVPAAKHTKR